MEQTLRKKRSILINPKFQWTLIGYAAFIATLIFLSVYGLFSFGFHEFVQIGHQAGLPDDHVYFQFIKMQETTFLRVILAIAFFVGTILTVGGLVVSHKIAGPLYRLQKELLGMAAKPDPSLHKINFRDGDFFPEVPQAFNELVEKVTAKKK
jgi:ABC-type multidrug transport system fused ATPase/permease subunit